MFKKLALLSCLLSSTLSASDQSVEEYIGKISDIYIGKSETIKVGIVREEDNDLNCELHDNYQWPLYFDRGQSYSEQWFEIINLARRTQETVRIGYTPSEESNCAIEYLALLKGDGSQVDDDPVGDSLSRTGQFGNIALIFTNNLTESNYTASNHYSGDVAEAAFDGYTWKEQITDGEGSLINRGIWLTKKPEDKDDESEHWLQVKFDDVVEVSGFRVLVNAKSVELGRSPRDITILVSTDGQEFIEQDAYRLSKAIDQRANLSEKVELQYFRIRVDTNYGDNYIEIDELEIYSN